MRTNNSNSTSINIFLNWSRCRIIIIIIIVVVVVVVVVRLSTSPRGLSGGVFVLRTTVTVLISLLRNQPDSSHYWTRSAGAILRVQMYMYIYRTFSFPGADDLSLFEKFERQHKGSSTHYSSPQLKRKEPVFTISHYASLVTYSIQVTLLLLLLLLFIILGFQREEP